MRILNLEQNSIGDEGVEYLAAAISRHKTLQILNLSSNHLTNKSCEQFETMLAMNNSLLELYLRWNRITSVGGYHIFNGLQHSVLGVLDLS